MIFFIANYKTFPIFREFVQLSSSICWLVMQRWADCEIFQSKSNPDAQKLNPMQSWSGKCLKISPFQSWSAHVQPSFFIFPQRKNIHSILAFPILNKEVSILLSGASDPVLILGPMITTTF